MGELGQSTKKLSPDAIINLDNGDPTMYEKYWQEIGNKCDITINGSQFTSYFSDPNNFCWFLEPELAEEIKMVHAMVGNAVTDNRYLIVGNGSSQLFQAALYALCSPEASKPMNVVAAVPFYSCYPAVTDLFKSGLHKWAGDARTYDKDEPYIEVVTSPNNPDGFKREAVVNRDGGKLIHDLAYYWPQYTAITSPADYDIMLFTVSKSTGHAGCRIGWALVKDKDVAEKMRKLIEVTTIGVSKDSQLRAAKILRIVNESCRNPRSLGQAENFFEYINRKMVERWERLRAAIKQNGLFTLPEYPKEMCNFSGDLKTSTPGFAWLESKGEIEDIASFFRNHKILSRCATFSGLSNARSVRVSLLDREETFNLFLERLASFKI